MGLMHKIQAQIRFGEIRRFEGEQWRTVFSGKRTGDYVNFRIFLKKPTLPAQRGFWKIEWLLHPMH